MAGTQQAERTVCAGERGMFRGTGNNLVVGARSIRVGGFDATRQGSLVKEAPVSPLSISVPSPHPDLTYNTTLPCVVYQ